MINFCLINLRNHSSANFVRHTVVLDSALLFHREKDVYHSQLQGLVLYLKLTVTHFLIISCKRDCGPQSFLLVIGSSIGYTITQLWLYRLLRDTPRVPRHIVVYKSANLFASLCSSRDRGSL
ncbi:hypothetical protein Plhal304r1_c028g0093051 [Plasmopara halstedii]